MRLLTGPAGSGKTSFVVERFVEALRAKNDAVRLLVPTATLAQHLQNRIARAGFVFHGNRIQTLSGFIDAWAGERPEAPAPVFHLLVEEAVRRVNRPEFRRVAALPGFSASVAGTVAEFASAGCDSAQLAEHLPKAPLAAAFLAVYREADRALERRGLALRGQRLERAAARIRAEGLGGIQTIWLDGFHALPDPELAVIEALGRHAEVTLTLCDTDAGEAMRARLWAMGFEEERAAGESAEPEFTLFQAYGIEREVEEIARRIVEQAGGGRPFREMGIIVRAAETYVPLLRATLERFGIPARFYFETELQRHPAVRFLTGAVEAMQRGWDHEATLAVLRLAPRFADSVTMDRFDFNVREQAPDSGLGGLRVLLGGREGALERVIDSLASLEEWRSFEMNPADWAARCHTLRNLLRAARPVDGADHAAALAGYTQTAALDAFDIAIEEAAQALDPERPIGLAEFWRALESVLRLKPLRVNDGRRNVVHVLSAPEARQWALPVVFICGMVEGQFPQRPRQDSFFPDAARVELNAAGIRVRTAAEWEREERALFDSAITRGSERTILSYPRFDARGTESLPSAYLEELGLTAESARLVRPQPRYTLTPLLPPAIRAPALLELLRRKTARLSPSGLESYLQCPFQYFGGRLLRLEARPLRPKDRLDFRKQGDLVHAVLAQWYAEPQDIGALFERVFAQFREAARVPEGYHTERLRQAMREDLERFAADEKWPRDGFQSRMEEPFEFALDESLSIRGKIDRLDTAADGRTYVFDYKYSALSVKERVKNADSFQPPLYMMAAEKKFGATPAGMFYVGVKNAVEYAGWAEAQLLKAGPMPENWLAEAARRAVATAEQIREGRIRPQPANPKNCRFCDSRDVCRIEVRVTAAESA